MSTLDDVPAKWHKYLRALASDCELEPNELLRLAPDLRIELSRELAEDNPSNQLIGYAGLLQDESMCNVYMYL